MAVTRSCTGMVMLVAVRGFEGHPLRLVTCMETKARLEAGVDITQKILFSRNCLENEVTFPAR